MTRKEAAAALDVTPRTSRTGTGGREFLDGLPDLRILRGYALPGVYWEDWTVKGRDLISPTVGHSMRCTWLTSNRCSVRRDCAADVARSGIQKTIETVIPFPDRRRKPRVHTPPQAQPQRIEYTMKDEHDKQTLELVRRRAVWRGKRSGTRQNVRRGIAAPSAMDEGCARSDCCTTEQEAKPPKSFRCFVR